MALFNVPNDAKLKPIKVVCTQGFYDALLSLVCCIRPSDLSGELPCGLDLKKWSDSWLDFLKSDQIAINDKI